MPAKKPDAPGGISLVVRRTIAADATFLFDAWTRPELLRQWWGPPGVTCTEAAVELRDGGAYRIANRMPDGRTLWIVGEIEEVAAPHRLVYTWRTEPPGPAGENSRVTVRFEPRGDATEVVVVHEHIPDAATRASHEAGWTGCLDGLAEFAAPG